MSTSASPETTNDVEADVLEWLREALEDPDVSATDNFLEIGGHSMMAIELNAFLGEKHGVAVNLADLFRESLGGASATAAPIA